MQQGEDIDTICQSIAIKKQFPKTQSTAIQVLTKSLKRISEANQVLVKIELQVTTKYDSTNPEHEAKLLEVKNNNNNIIYF